MSFRILASRGHAQNRKSEDLVSAVLHYSMRRDRRDPGRDRRYGRAIQRADRDCTEPTEAAIVTGDQLTTWDVRDDAGEPAPIARDAKSGASDPMAISLTPFERQLADFGEACKTGRPQASSGVDGYRALQLVRSVYTSCAEGRKVQIVPPVF